MIKLILSIWHGRIIKIPKFRHLANASLLWVNKKYNLHINNDS